jgi:hypothetical protein
MQICLVKKTAADDVVEDVLDWAKTVGARFYIWMRVFDAQAADGEVAEGRFGY